MAVDTSQDSETFTFCQSILPQVSRTFAINIRVLEGELQRAVLCAYLFCRIVDTVEDATHLTQSQRETLLDGYATLFQSEGRSPESLQSWISQWGDLDRTDPEQNLVANLDLVEAVFATLPEAARAPVRECVRAMSLGMLKTIRRSCDPQSSLHALDTVAELEEYCYFVAGTVGRMLTNLFCHFLPDIDKSAHERLVSLDQSFARGLQMTNIIKDARRDFQRGWLYIPREMIVEAGVAPNEFFQFRHAAKSISVFDRLIKTTAHYLRDALEYTLLIPKQHVSVRLFNLWSLFFAIRTLRRTNHNLSLIAGSDPVKIPRWEVYYTIAQTRRLVTNDDALRRLFGRLSANII